VKEAEVRVQILPHFEGLELPQYMSSSASGFDLLAACAEPVTLLPGQRARIPTGIAIELPHGLEAQVRPRSGLAYKYGITLLNTPGTIDADYRGEVQVIVVNFGEESFSITRGMRIAQVVLSEVVKANFKVADTLNATRRGNGGFGHTGI